MKNITIEFPENLAVSLKMEDDEFVYEIKKMALLKLYELGKISSGTAASILDTYKVNSNTFSNKISA